MAVSVEERSDNCAEHGEFKSRGILFPGRDASTIRWAMCPTCADIEREKTEAADREKEAQEAQDRMERRLGEAGIPLRFKAKDFASYVAGNDKQEKALAVAMEFAQNFGDHLKKGTVAVFSGLPGTGKSHLAIAIAQTVMKDGTALYTSAIDAVRMVRDTWRKGSERTETQVLQLLATVDLLVLDEIGVQYGTEAEQVTLFDIIDKRYRDMMPTILLTNLNKSGVKAFLGDRSFDRLREGGIWVTFDWDSHRGNAMKESS